MTITRRVTPLALTAIAGAALVAPRTHAAVINWASGTSGSATTLTNWNPQALPTASDTITFNVVGGYIVTWGSGAPSTVANLHVGTSNAGFNFVTPLTVTGDCIIQNVSSSAGGASTISSGTLTVANLTIGAAPHPTVGGQFHINGATAHLNVNNSCILGSANTALLRVLAGASMTSGTTVRVGATANGTMVVSGVAGAPADRSTLQLTGAASSLRVGDGSQGALTISDGALVTMDGDTFAAPVSGVQGSITVTGSAGGHDATLTIPGNLYIANNNAAGAGGIGTVRVQSGSTVSVTGQTTIGDVSPSSGLLEVSGGTFLTHGLIASGGTGTFAHSTGTAIVDGGPLSIQTGGGIYNVAGTIGGGVLTLRNNAQWTLPAPGFSANQVFLTSVGAGSTLNLQTGSDLVHTGAELRIGITNQRGTLTIDGGSTLTTNATLNMGGTGSSISVTGGSSLTTGTMNIAGNTGDANSFSVSGVGSVLSTSGLTRFGHNLTGGGGECQLAITNGAVLNSTFVDPSQASLRFRHVSGAGGSLLMSQGTINAADAIEYSNTATPLSMTASTINAPMLIINGATLNGNGTINADLVNTGQIQPSGPGFILLGTLDDNGTGVTGSRLTFGDGSSYTGDGNLSCEVQTLPGSTLTPSGDLLLGNHASVNGVAIGGTLNVGPHTVELRDFNGAVISGTVNLAGGTLFNPSSVLFGGGASTTIEGHGAVVGQCRIQDARLQPGHPNGDQTGHIAFDSLNFDSTGIFGIDIEGEAPGQFDSVSSGDEVELNGLRVTVTLRGAYTPAIGTRFRVLTGSIVDDQVQLIDSPGFTLEFVPGAMDAVYVGACDPVDFNGDGLFPDTADIDDFLSVFSGGPCGTGTCNDVDFNNDGLFPDTTDIDALLSVFSGGPCF